MSTSKKKLILKTVSVNLGCGSCKKVSLSNIFQPKPRPKTRTYTTNLCTPSSSSSTKLTNLSSSPNAYDTPSTFSPEMDDDDDVSTPHEYQRSCNNSKNKNNNNKKKKNKKTRVSGLGRLGGESVAVEKDSDDPYLDFRQSMLQMILEKEIYSKDDLRDLLNCFLQLNSPYHHGIIVRAFTEIWNGVFSVRSPAVAAANAAPCDDSSQKLLLRYYYGGN
ncbi:hypothetical protein Tsubulata_015299 [Turnera subulata]|uniref:Transcription repressor n=1 Tax=Turnera subulata TaxID=218843 RepID=A0A9Q0JDD0_9ROSI|nr:hypothetical protein Tsubulata_015299 [Turnera subulata]